MGSLDEIHYLLPLFVVDLLQLLSHFHLQPTHEADDKRNAAAAVGSHHPFIQVSKLVSPVYKFPLTLSFIVACRVSLSLGSIRAAYRGSHSSVAAPLVTCCRPDRKV